MTPTQQQLQDIANQRRAELLPYIFNQTGGRVQTGPFAGMTIVPKTCWGDGDTAAKLMGVYEDELHEFVEDAIARKPDAFLNIGAAEGYYLVGLARRMPWAIGYGVDVNPQFMSAVGENIEANAVSGVELHLGEINIEWLEKTINLIQRPLLVVDCEGAELGILNPVGVPSLQRATILVECHDCAIPGITDAMLERFRPTHNIQAVKQKFKDPYQFDFCDELSDCDKWALVHEGRPSTMTWLYMTPTGL